MLGEHDVIDRLRAVKPANVLVVQGDGSTTKVAVPLKGQRWSRVWAVVSKLPWSELRALNKSGEVLEVIVRDPQGMEDLSTPASDGAHGLAQLFAAHTVNITRTLAEAMRAAREQAGTEMMAILDAHRDLARDAFTLRAETLTENAQLRTEVERLRMELHAATSSGGGAGEAREQMLLELMKGLGGEKKKLPASTPAAAAKAGPAS
jgi:hypothetical protein